MSFSIKRNNNRILVVDDEEDVLDFLRLYLHSLGWEVTAASTVELALGNLEQRPYFLVITDVAMPEMDGYEFINQLQNHKIQSEVALMTGFGYNPKHTLVRIHKTMRHPFFFKPFNTAKLAEGAQAAWYRYHKDILVPPSAR
jgi:DNA-binding NtrC family response regulator